MISGCPKSSAMVGLIVLILFRLCYAEVYTPKVSQTTWDDKQVMMAAYFENSPNVMALFDGYTSLSTDDGATWNEVPELRDHRPVLMEIDPYFPERAFIFSSKSEHFVTNDRGKTWGKFEVLSDKGKPVSEWTSLKLNFNCAKKEYLILTVLNCGPLMQSCRTDVLVTKDGFQTNPSIVLDGAKACVFARSDFDFDPSVKAETIFCAKNEVNSFGHIVKSNLLKSTNFFKNSEIIDHVYLKNGEIIDVRVESAFLVVVLKKDKFAEAQVSLVVSKDASMFRSADIDFEITFGAIIFLKSTPSSLRLSLYYQGRITKEEVMHFSDSDGLKFRKIANVGLLSAVSSANVEGVWFADVKQAPNSMNFPTRYSFDDGKTWEPLELTGDESCKVKDGCSLHFFPENGGGMITPLKNTPNVLMSVGAKGPSFNLQSEVNTYVSRDGGASWKLALNGPAIIAYADQGNIIIAMPATGTHSVSEKLHYSLDQGISWSTLDLKYPISPVEIATFDDLSGLKMVIFGRKGKQSVAYSVDFSDAFGGNICDKNDYETVNTRVLPDASGPVCVRGHKSSFNRRKNDAKCLVKAASGSVEVKNEPCECTEADFECSPFFKLSEKGACVPIKEEITRLCMSSKKKTLRVPHNQHASGNDCKLKGSQADFIAETDFNCETIEEENGSFIDNAISVTLSTLNGIFDQYSYIESGNSTSNILIHTDKKVIHASNNGGVSFVNVPVEDEILFFMTGPVAETAVLVSLNFLYFTSDGGNNFIKFQSPGIPTTSGLPIVFHPTDAKKFMFMSEDQSNTDGMVYYTEDGGASFKRFPVGYSFCNYVADSVKSDQNLIYCVVPNNNNRKLLASSDYFQSSSELFENVLTFAVKPNFVLVATISDSQNLQLKVTADGKTFADADFPSDYSVGSQTTYTILDSHPHSVFLHLTTNRDEGREFGALLKSNSNGTSYVLSLDNVNRDRRGYVDFDRIDILEGVLVANVVMNPYDRGVKRLVTKISYSDGSQWSYLTPPSIDSQGKKYKCTGESLEKCSLHLHGFTERPDYRDTFSSSSAIGFLIGVGNVGESLESYEKGSTFISADGGLTWKEISKGVFFWEYGDRGTILVLVNAAEPTDSFLYSTDDGNTWQTLKFADLPVIVRDLATVPTDTARKFVIFAQSDMTSSSTLIYSIDFTKFYKRQCQIDLDNPLRDDFDYWSPRHPDSADNCLFGHETQYLRRAQGHYDCFIGAAPLSTGMKTVKNCTCTRRDYECDYNYFRDSDGTCKLVAGLTPQDRKEKMCSKSDTFEYFEPTGYRKIPISTCVGGKAFDSWDARPCPGHEKEFNIKYGRTFTFGKFLLVVLFPLGIFFGATWFVYERGIKRNGGFARLGQIRLSEDDDFDPIEENGVDMAVNKVVKGGIIAVAGLIAVLKTIRSIDRRLFENAARIAFGRRPGRRDYVRVPDDEDELFGNFEDNFEDNLGEGVEISFSVDDEPEQFDDFADESAEANSRLFDIDDEEQHSDS